ncbi:type II toxin-antitoxin system VapB family antitoxin [Streptosporangium sp. V21-05]|uniref:type II toxin-antitoxin system VapB family antitoxin n=1 Tax=Streptosporangium sp. V21-05 TaxID=3446115 RepID=UPI003F53BAFC
MSVIRIGLDDEALAKATRMPGSTTKRDMANAALRGHVTRVRRVEALKALSTRAARGGFDDAEKARRTAKRTPGRAV